MKKEPTLMRDWLRRFFCRHDVSLKTTGPARVSPRGAEFFAILPAVEVTCSRCGEFWLAELDASQAMKAALD